MELYTYSVSWTSHLIKCEFFSNQPIDSMQFQSKSQKVPCVHLHMSSKHALDKQHIS